MPIIIAFYIMLAVAIGFPLAYSWRVYRLRPPTFSGWLLVALESALVVALVIIIGRWDIAGAYTRFALLPAFLFAIIASWRRHQDLPWRADPAPSAFRQRWPNTLSLVLLCAALAYLLAGFVPDRQSSNLAFPLTGGDFIIGQGGGNPLLNYHATHPQQRRAVDITAINAAGFRAAGLTPSALDAYEIYGASVISPCAGEVLETQDGRPDLLPPQTDREHPAGNHVILACEGLEISLAHLQPATILVSPGDQLAAGDPIGRVGNSGNTTEPHLHIHAIDPDTNRGVQLRFDSRTPVRNVIFRR